MKKVVLILIDGLSNSVANEMGYLKALEENGKIAYTNFFCELPAISRPLYEAILTGKTPVESGIINNNPKKMSSEKSIFHFCSEHNLTTAAAAYYWISELYNSYPYEEYRDRITLNSEKIINHGIFYSEDDYPDNAVFADARFLIDNYCPSFVLIHTMNIDLAGHNFGVDSKEYRDSSRNIDMILSKNINYFINKNYEVIITADHGMNNDRTHTGDSLPERSVPFWGVGKNISEFIKKGNITNQLKIKEVIEKILI